MTVQKTAIAIVEPASEPETKAPVDDSVGIRWTVDGYLSIIEAGILTELHATELLAGTIIQKMPSNKPHDAAVSFVQDYFTERYFGTHTLRSERAIRLSATSMPEPDFVVAVFREDKYKDQWPTPPDVLLLIEVSDTTLSIDRGSKRELYAKAGIREYWIVNVTSQQVEVHLTPDATDGTYRQLITSGRGQTFESPFAGPVAVDDLLPPA